MTAAAASVSFGPHGADLAAATPLPLEALLLGQTVERAAELLPRLFNLCRAAQTVAAHLALGLPVAADPLPEIVRDHKLKLCILLPRSFGLPPVTIPADAADLLGHDGLPSQAAELAHWQAPLAPLLAHVAAAFPPGVACSAALPPPPDPLKDGAYENSAAGRQATHPLLCSVEASHGRGPLWRLCGLLADLQAALRGGLPAPRLADGIATVPAARGSYALRLSQRNGLITGIARRTPTDHMLAPGGALLQALSALPPGLRGLAPQVITLHDPCIPVLVREVQHA